jgi:hypothetical protein
MFCPMPSTRPERRLLRGISGPSNAGTLMSSGLPGMLLPKKATCTLSLWAERSAKSAALIAPWK